MAGLRNSFRFVDPAAPFLPVGDALVRTDPTLAHGLSFALIHARALRDVLRQHRSRSDVLGVRRRARATEERHRLLEAVVPHERKRHEP